LVSGFKSCGSLFMLFQRLAFSLQPFLMYQYLVFMKPRQRKISAIASRLLEWFPKNARDLPWRRTQDPYAIWVSEIMLQQTQVKTVVPYWQRWMQALPTIEAVAAARLQQIHKLWEGLGYYTRARNLHKAAQTIVERHGSKFPRRFEDVLELPGIGRYTAGAICSIAFDQQTPILDGNVIRVLTRLFGINGTVRESKVRTELWHIAERLVQTAAKLQGIEPRSTLHAQRFCSMLNQSLMELGALICNPNQPHCGGCPVANCCAAFRQGRVNDLPRRSPRPRTVPRRFIALVLRSRGRFLVRQRPAGVVNANLWEFPNAEVALKNSDPGKVAQSLFGAKSTKLVHLCTIKHSITRYRITLEAFRSQLDHGAKRSPDGARWLNRSQLQRVPFASAHKRILELAIDLPGRGQ
jgi:A/G-specific adenine glycosylase